MAILDDLKQQAAVIRDETKEGNNTALRVGSTLMAIIQKLEAILPSSLVDAATIGDAAVDYNANSITIKLGTVADDGTTDREAFTIMPATATKAGIMSGADKAQLAVLDAAIKKERSDRDEEILQAREGLTDEYKRADNALKSSLESKITAEATARQDADAKITKKVDTLYNYAKIRTFYGGVESLEDLCASYPSQDTDTLAGQIVYFTDLQRFDIVDDWGEGIVADVVFRDRKAWDYTDYNEGGGSSARAKAGVYKSIAELYTVKFIRIGERKIVRLVGEDELVIVAKALAAQMGIISGNDAQAAEIAFIDWLENK